MIAITFLQFMGYFQRGIAKSRDPFFNWHSPDERPDPPTLKQHHTEIG
jgi:hypothetical protein